MSIHFISYSALHVLWTVGSETCTVPNNIVSNRKPRPSQWIVMKWAGHVARVGERRGFCCGSLKKRDHLEDAGLDGRIILIWICKKWVVRAWTGSSWLKIGTGGRQL